MSGSSVVEDWSSQMDRHYTATAGSAAEVSEVVIVDDPDFAVEVGKTNESRVASLRGLHQEEGCDKDAQNKNMKKNKMLW